MDDAGGRPLSGMTVMIAEDYWLLADAMRLAVDGAGAKVAGMAATLEEAERIAAVSGIDTAVMDLNLRDRQANDLVLQLAAAGIKVVVLTGYEPPAALVGKVHDCLTKPVATEKLIESLARPARDRGR